MAQRVYAYGIVVLPPPHVRREIAALRRRHPVLHASVPPHITVKAPFVLRSTGAWALERLEEICAAHEPFELELDGLDSFGTEVLYVRVAESEPLRRLHQDLVDGLAGYVETLRDRYEGKAYTPHLTVADHLTPEEFALARRELAGWHPRARFEVDAVHLLRGWNRWDVTRSIPLSCEL
ncbi:2'-5' RNA ligase family protein [Caldinitratiruptor microaerophilus]|uniref:Phosphoesterase n=1 Tax=Caldinitratiruptor microaerophilus TaxID=671077 RepID=A0AA35CL01_9FIRM|nr:2'-5' RNA ligase family protein [Caldinitratiruptor microaerophilus]BDG61244.1 putative phosphoesterase [Caldinitratiruptor microaerophilus]